MVLVIRPVSPNGAKYILVEYTHINRHESFVADSELDSIAWKFSLRPVFAERTRNLYQLGPAIRTYGVRWRSESTFSKDTRMFSNAESACSSFIAAIEAQDNHGQGHLYAK